MAVSAQQSMANIQGLYDQGYSQQQVASFDYGKKMNSGEVQQFIQQAGPSQMQVAKNNISAVASQQYQFDPNQFLPDIQKQAESIYSPQKAQLEAIRQLQSSQYEDARITTEKDFDKQLKTEIESINNRGAYFGGGAIEREQELGDTKLRALNQLGLQAQAADFSNLAQQGILAADEAQFIQDRLYNAEASAYNRWMDQRNFSYQAALQEYNMYSQERDFARNVFESDRTFDMETQKMEMMQKQFEQTYDITSQEFEMAKEQFNVDMKIKNLSYEQALSNFKKNSANSNFGWAGVDYNGDREQQWWDEANGGMNNNTVGDAKIGNISIGATGSSKLTSNIGSSMFIPEVTIDQTYKPPKDGGQIYIGN